MSKASGYDRVADDWYLESADTVRALFAAEQFPRHVHIHDPCCGGGNVPRVAIALGYSATGADIADRGYGDVVNFLDDFRPQEVIVSNPPYGIIEPFIRHAVTISPLVCVVARLAFLEGRSRARDFWPVMPIARVWVSGPRLSMPPGGTVIVAKGGSIAYAWFVFARGYQGSPTLGWLP